MLTAFLKYILHDLLVTSGDVFCVTELRCCSDE